MLKTSEVIKYIEKKNNIELTDYQRDMLKHIIAGDVIYTPRNFGRSMLYAGYADYLKDVVGKSTDYSIDSNDFDKVYTYKDAPTLYPDDLIENIFDRSEEIFDREYACKYKV